MRDYRRKRAAIWWCFYLEKKQPLLTVIWIGLEVCFNLFFVCSKNNIIVRWNKQLISTVGEKYLYWGKKIKEIARGTERQKIVNGRKLFKESVVHSGGCVHVFCQQWKSDPLSWLLTTVYIRTPQHNSIVNHIQIHTKYTRGHAHTHWQTRIAYHCSLSAPFLLCYTLTRVQQIAEFMDLISPPSPDHKDPNVCFWWNMYCVCVLAFCSVSHLQVDIFSMQRNS